MQSLEDMRKKNASLITCWEHVKDELVVTYGDADPAELESMRALCDAKCKELREQKEALEIKAQLEGLRADDEQRPKLLKQLGDLLIVQDKFAEAEPLYLEALPLLRKALGNRHPDTLDAIDNFAGVLMRLDKFAEAVLLEQELLQHKRETLGDRHPVTLLQIKLQARLLHNAGERRPHPHVRRWQRRN